MASGVRRIAASRTGRLSPGVGRARALGGLARASNPLLSSRRKFSSGDIAARATPVVASASVSQRAVDTAGIAAPKTVVPDPPTASELWSSSADVESVSRMVASAVEVDAGEVTYHFYNTWFYVLKLQDLIHYVHSPAGLDVPWWVAIAGLTMSFRMCLLPLSIMQAKTAVRMQNMRPEIEKLNQEMKDRRQQLGGQFPADEMLKYKLKMRQVQEKHNANPVKAFAVPLAQMPIFIASFFACRSLPERFDGLDTGGIGWITDLTAPDPYYVMPCLTAATMIVSMELGRIGQPVTRTTKIMSWAMRAFACALIPLSSIFPASLHFYWVPSNIVQLLSVFLTKVSPFKDMLGVPQQILSEPAAKLKKKMDAEEKFKAENPVRDMPEVKVEKPVTFSFNPKEGTSGKGNAAKSTSGRPQRSKNGGKRRGGKRR